MSEMIDRVAEAIRTHCARIWGVPHLYAVVRGAEFDKPLKSGLSSEAAHQEAARLNAIAAIRAMSAWRPIESAPRDGTVILIPDDTWGVIPTRWTVRNGPPAWRIHGDYDRHPHCWQPLSPPPVPSDPLTLPVGE